VVGVTRIELATSRPPAARATSCATPRYKIKYTRCMTQITIQERFERVANIFHRAEDIVKKANNSDGLRDLKFFEDNFTLYGPIEDEIDTGEKELVFEAILTAEDEAIGDYSLLYLHPKDEELLSLDSQWSDYFSDSPVPGIFTEHNRTVTLTETNDSPNVQALVFLHELRHAVLFNLRGSKNQNDSEHDLEEVETWEYELRLASSIWGEKMNECGKYYTDLCSESSDGTVKPKDLDAIISATLGADEAKSSDTLSAIIEMVDIFQTAKIRKPHDYKSSIAKFLRTKTDEMSA
jgi:hypothetical protein